jgi:hypothetical protein
MKKLVERTVRYLFETVMIPIRQRQLTLSLERLASDIQLLHLQQVRNSSAAMQERDLGATKPTCAIMTVVKIPENILFLEEWIDHHINVGINYFFVYDNTASQMDNNPWYDATKMGFDGTSVNKHGVDYASALRATLGDISWQEKFEQIREKYKGILRVIKWEKRDESGKVCYFQLDAIRHFATSCWRSIDYAFCIDVDEFLLSDCGWRTFDLFNWMEQQNITSAFLGQRRFLHRFASLDTPVRQIQWCYKEDVESVDYNACKTCFRVNALLDFEREPHSPHTIGTVGRQQRVAGEFFRFNHYQVPYVREKQSISFYSSNEMQFLRERFREDFSIFRYADEIGASWSA